MNSISLTAEKVREIDVKYFNEKTGYWYVTDKQGIEWIFVDSVTESDCPGMPPRFYLQGNKLQQA